MTPKMDNMVSIRVGGGRIWVTEEWNQDRLDAITVTFKTQDVEPKTNKTNSNDMAS